MKFNRLIGFVSAVAIMVSLVSPAYAETVTVTETVTNEYTFNFSGITYTNDTSKVFKGTEVGDAGLDDSWYFYNPSEQSIYIPSNKNELVVQKEEPASYISLMPEGASKTGEQIYNFQMQFTDDAAKEAYVYAVEADTILTNTEVYSGITDVLYKCEDTGLTEITIEIDNDVEAGSSTFTVKKDETVVKSASLDYVVGGICFSKGNYNATMKVKDVSVTYDKETVYTVEEQEQIYDFNSDESKIVDLAPEISTMFSGADIGDYRVDGNWSFYRYNQSTSSITLTTDSALQLYNKITLAALQPFAGELTGTQTYTAVVKSNGETYINFIPGDEGFKTSYTGKENTLCQITSDNKTHVIEVIVNNDNDVAGVTIKVDGEEVEQLINNSNGNDEIDGKISGIYFANVATGKTTIIDKVSYTYETRTEVEDTAPDQPPEDDWSDYVNVANKFVGAETGDDGSEATGFLITINNTDEISHSFYISWTITSSNGTGTYIHPTDFTIEGGSGINIALIIKGLYDEEAQIDTELLNNIEEGE